MDIEPKMQDAPDAIELEDIKGEIEFKDVWFSYIPGEWVLAGRFVPCEPPPDRGIRGLHGLRQEHDSLPHLPQL